MCVVHTLYYGQACTLKIASDCTRNAPLTEDQVFSGHWRNCFLELQKSTRGCLIAPTHASFLRQPAQGAQVLFLVYRRATVEEKSAK